MLCTVVSAVVEVPVASPDDKIIDLTDAGHQAAVSHWMQRCADASNARAVCVAAVLHRKFPGVIRVHLEHELVETPSETTVAWCLHISCEEAPRDAAAVRAMQTLALEAAETVGWFPTRVVVRPKVPDVE